MIDHHLTDKKLSRVHIKKKDKWLWRMLNPIWFNKILWVGGRGVETISTNCTGGWLKYGILFKTKTLGCTTWCAKKATKQEVWIGGTNDWIKYSGTRK